MWAAQPPRLQPHCRPPRHLGQDREGGRNVADFPTEAKAELHETGPYHCSSMASRIASVSTREQQTPPRITRSQIKDALLRSGYLLESRLESILRDREYFVNANASYPDPILGKSRELDLHAQALWPITDDSAGHLRTGSSSRRGSNEPNARGSRCGARFTWAGRSSCGQSGATSGWGQIPRSRANRSSPGHRGWGRCWSGWRARTVNE